MSDYRREVIMMPTISNKQFQDYEQLCYDRINGKVLTADGIRFICEAYNYDAEKIGQHFIEELPRICQGQDYRKREESS